MNNIATECGVTVSDLTPSKVQNNLEYFPVPDDQLWRVSLVRELLDARKDKCKIENLNSQQISFFIEDLCTS